MRGVSAGVLDVFLERAFDPFDLMIGTSAGACNLASHIAKQHGRNQRCFLRLMTQRSFIDLRRFFWRGGHSLDLDWLWDELARVEPLDVAAIVGSGKEFVVVTTSADTGQPVYLRPTADTMLRALKASCALPLLYRGQVRVEDARVVDGGMSDPIPVREAYARGARRIKIIRSRPACFIKRGSLFSHLLSLALPSRRLGAALRAAPARYRAAVEFMLEPPADCRIIQVSPPVALPVARMTQDPGALERSYALGRHQGEAAISAWMAPSRG